MNQRVAFFDFDGTIIRGDSFMRFARFSLSRTRFILALLRFIPHFIKWKLGMIDNSAAKEKLFSLMYKGVSTNEFAKSCADFADVINKNLRHSVMTGLNLHFEQGYTVAIVSASIADWIRPWAIANGIDHVIATEVETDNAGRLTGRFATPNCYAAEKVRRILEIFPDINPATTAAYSDSPSDAPMLSLSDHPVLLPKK